jgi:hypothetical protein
MPETQARLTRAEMLVLHSAIESRDQNYQPSADALATANRLYDQGLLQAADDFPDVTVATDAGLDAYRAEIETLTYEHGDDWVARHFR